MQFAEEESSAWGVNTAVDRGGQTRGHKYRGQGTTHVIFTFQYMNCSSVRLTDVIHITENRNKLISAAFLVSQGGRHQ